MSLKDLDSYEANYYPINRQPKVDKKVEFS
jgi:hypothetical protein